MVRCRNHQRQKRTRSLSKNAAVANKGRRKVIVKSIKDKNKGIIQICHKSLPYIKLHDIAFDENICLKYNLKFDIKIKKEEPVCESTLKQIDMDCCNIEQSVNNNKNYKNRKKKIWNIKYKFLVDKITSASPIFSNNPLLLQADVQKDASECTNLSDKRVVYKDSSKNLQVKLLNVPIKGNLINTQAKHTETLCNGFAKGIERISNYAEGKSILDKPIVCTAKSPSKSTHIPIDHNKNISNNNINVIDETPILNNSIDNTTTNASIDNNRSQTDSKIRFKKPLLPLSKRPPTRRITCNSNNVNGYIGISISLRNTDESINVSENLMPSKDIDDAISLCASAFDFLEQSTNNLEDDFRSFSDSSRQSTSDSERLNNETTVSRDNLLNEKTKYIESWIKEACPSGENVCQKNLEDTCIYTSSKYDHSLPPNTKNDVSKMNIDDLTKFTKCIKSNHSILLEMLPCLIDRAKTLNNRTYLMNLIDDILLLESLDKTPLINMILESLQNDNYSLEKVIQDILLLYGSQKYVLCDILLSIVTSKAEPLITNWQSIRTLVKYRNNIDFGVVNDILKKIVNEDQVNVDLMKSICNDILLTHNVLLEKIDVRTIQQFLLKLQEFDLADYINEFVQHHKTVFDEWIRNNVIFIPRYLENIIKSQDKFAFKNLFLGNDVYLKAVATTFIKLRKKLCMANNQYELRKIDNLALNTIILFYIDRQYKEALRIVNMYENVTSLIIAKSFNEAFLNDFVLKYLLIMAIYTKNRLLSRAYNLILQKDWEIHFKTAGSLQQVISDRRKQWFIGICKELFEVSITTGYIQIKDVLLYLLEKNLFVTELDVPMHLNKFLLFTTKRKLSNEDKWSLVTFVKRCYLHVHRDILRMLLIHLIDGLEISHKAELFNICCAVGVYTRITGLELVLELPKNLTTAEVHLILQIYFSKLSNLYGITSRVTIILGHPIPSGEFLSSHLQTELSLEDVQNILKHNFNIIKTILSDQDLVIET